jgi:hypothetical protein
MDSSRFFFGIIVPAGLIWRGVSASIQEESEMNATALSPGVGVDNSKNVFELAVAHIHMRV